MNRRAFLAALPALPALVPAGAAAANFDAPGPYRAEVLDLHWTDVARGRSLPLRLRLPQAAGPRPLILFSHGLGGSVEGGRDWGEHWSSHGFVVIHLQHPGSDESVWAQSARPAPAMKEAASPAQLAARVRDVRFVLDELERRSRAGEPIAVRADLARIGMSGHSFGAITTQAIAGQHFPLARQAGPIADARPRAFVAFSPSARGREQLPHFSAIARPFFSVTGTDDGIVGPGLGVPPAQRLLPYEGMPAGDKYLLNLADADHMFFGGGPQRRGAEAIDRRRAEAQRRIVKAATTAFWRAYLLDDAEALAWLRSLDPALGGEGRFAHK